jgi:trk system potassium uptake protein
MNIMVIGCGRVGSELASSLFERGHRVTVIDRDATAFDILPPEFRGHTVLGDVLSQGVLRRAGIEQSDGLAAVTNSDAVNAVVARAAKVVYGVPNVVLRNYDPRWQPMHEVFGYQVVSSATYDAQRLERLLCHSEIHSVFSAGHGEVSLYEVPVPEDWAGKSVADVLSDPQVRVVSITRAGRAALPGEGATLEAGEVVLLAATPTGIGHVRERLQPDGKG